MIGNSPFSEKSIWQRFSNSSLTCFLASSPGQHWLVRKTIAMSLVTLNMGLSKRADEFLEALRLDRALEDYVGEGSSRKQLVLDFIYVYRNFLRGSNSENRSAVLGTLYSDLFARIFAQINSNPSCGLDKHDKLNIGSGFPGPFTGEKRPNCLYPVNFLSYLDNRHPVIMEHVPALSASVHVYQKGKLEFRLPKPVIDGVSELNALFAWEVASLKAQSNDITLSQAMFDIERTLRAKDIANAHRKNPELSFQYRNQNGELDACIIAYQGFWKGEPAIYVYDLVARSEYARKQVKEEFEKRCQILFSEKGELPIINAPQ